jgi:hypothetical protein
MTNNATVTAVTATMSQCMVIPEYWFDAANMCHQLQINALNAADAKTCAQNMCEGCAIDMGTCPPQP